MRIPRPLVAVLLVAPLAAGLGVSAAADVPGAATPHEDVVDAALTGTTFLVDTAPGAEGAAAAQRAVRTAGAQVATSWPEIGVTVAVAPAAQVGAMVTSVRQAPGIQQAGISGALTVEAPRLPRLTAPAPTAPEVPGDIAAAAKAPQANAVATGRGVTLGVADTGVMEEDSEFAGRFDAEHSGSCTYAGAFRGGDASWRPSAASELGTHGTEVASAAVAAPDGHGIRGVAPEARLVAIRVVSDDGNIYPEAGICAAMAGARLGLPVLNHSYGLDWAGSGGLRHALWDPQQPDQAAVITAVTRAFDFSRAHGVLNVAATGNTGDDLSDKPAIPLPSSEEHNGPLPARLTALLAELPGVLAVSESGMDGTVGFESTVGFGAARIATVGAGVLATKPNDYQQDDGTSFASPAVAATAVLVKQLRPGAGPDELERLVLTTATPKTCVGAGELVSEQPCRSKDGQTNFFGHGLLDALAAVRVAAAAS